jgi:hypothetical protein
MSTKTKLRLKKIKGTPNILHVDSNLVLKSLEDKIIIGKYEDDEIKLLTSSDIELCKEWNFSFDDERVSNEEENEVENEVENNEEEEQEENNEDDNEEENEEEEKDENSGEKEEVQDSNPVQVIVQEKDSEEYVHISETPKPTQILDITEQFTKDIHNHFDLLTHHYTDKITNYENKISTMDIKYNELFNNYKTICEDHNNTRDELQKLKSKLEGIKSLFN